MFYKSITPKNYQRKINFSVIQDNNASIIYWINGQYNLLSTYGGTGNYSITLPADATSFGLGFSNSWSASVNGSYKIATVSEEALS